MKGLQQRQLEGPGIMEDAQGSKIQETGQEQRPARMVGLFLLDSARVGTDADSTDREMSRLQKGER